MFTSIANFSKLAKEDSKLSIEILNEHDKILEKIISIHNGRIIKHISEKGYFDVNKIKRANKTYFAKYGNKIFFYFVLIYITFTVILKIRENK